MQLLGEILAAALTEDVLTFTVTLIVRHVFDNTQHRQFGFLCQFGNPSGSM